MTDSIQYIHDIFYLMFLELWKLSKFVTIILLKFLFSYNERNVQFASKNFNGRIGFMFSISGIKSENKIYLRQNAIIQSLTSEYLNKKLLIYLSVIHKDRF